MSHKEVNENLRIRSGSFNSNDKLVSLLYELMRDYIPCGVMEELIRNSEQDIECQYSNGWLAEYAKDLAKRLK